MKSWRLQLAVAFAFIALSANAFNFNYNTNIAGAAALHWSFTTPVATVPTNSLNTNTHAIRYYIAADAYSTTNKTAEMNAVRNCFGQWQSISNTVIRFEEAGLAASGYTLNTSDNSNVVFWARSSAQVGGDNISGALGVTYSVFSVPDNTLKQFDIALNAVNATWFTDFNDTTNSASFVESVLLHEIGHALGLAHSSVGGATMLYAGPSGVNTQAGLSSDDTAFAHASGLTHTSDFVILVCTLYLQCVHERGCKRI